MRRWISLVVASMLFSVGTGIAIDPLIDGIVHGLVIMTGFGIAMAGLGWILDDYVWPALAMPTSYCTQRNRSRYVAKPETTLETSKVLEFPSQTPAIQDRGRSRAVIQFQSSSTSAAD
jgi:hypothetical protein